MTFRYQHGDRPLEGYTILRGIGRGGFGEVYYAMSDGGREVALKVIQQNHDVELRGINHCINLKSPHLVSIFDVKASADGAPFVVMEYVAGPSIRDLVRGAPNGLGAQKAVFLVHEIAKGLKYLHDRGIVHRDLKPENIFFEDGYVKIGDYGLSKYITMSRQSGQTISVGTVHYMAPEIGSGNYHHGIDIYALGVVFFELLTGDVPFNGDSMGEILMKHLTCEPDLSRVPEPFRPIIARALKKSPSERYSDLGQLVADLLAAGDAAKMIAGFDPSSLSARTTPTAVGAEGRPGAGAEAPRVEPRPFLPPRPPSPARKAAGAPDASPPRAASPPIRQRRELDARLGQTILTVLAMAFAMTIFSGGRWQNLWGYAILMGGATLAVSFVQLWWVPKFQIAPGLGRRMVIFGHGIPVVLLARAFLRQDLHLEYGMMAGLILLDWDLRTRESRREQVSIHLAFTAALVGLVATAIFGGPHVFLGGACLAGVSLAVNAFAPHAPARAKRRYAGDRAADGAFASPGEAVAGALTAPVQAAGSPAPPASLSEEGAPLRSQDVVESQPVRRSSTLVRPRGDRVLGGVASGIALRYGWEVVWLRAAFLLAALLGFGTGIVLYIVLWICMPEEPIPRHARNAPPLSVPRVLAKTSFGLAAAVLSFFACIAFFVEPPLRTGDRGFDHLAGGALFAIPALVGFVLAFAIRSRSPDSTLGRYGAGSSGGGGWSALGGLLFAIGLLPVAASALVTAGLVGPGPGEARALTAAERMIQGLGQHHGAILLSLAILLVSLFCMLAGRRVGGPAHVLRGALGWTLAVGLVYLLMRGLPAILGSFDVGAYGSGGNLARRVPDQASALLVIMILVLGVLSAVFLAWPRRPDRQAEDFMVESEERPEPAERWR